MFHNNWFYFENIGVPFYSQFDQFWEDTLKNAEMGLIYQANHALDLDQSF